MGFTVRGFRKIKTSVIVCGAYERYLSVLAWQCYTLRPTILVGCGISDNSSDRITISQCIAKRFDQKRCRAFSSSISGRSLVVTVATTLRREKSMAQSQFLSSQTGRATKLTESG